MTNEMREAMVAEFDAAINAYMVRLESYLRSRYFPSLRAKKRESLYRTDVEPLIDVRVLFAGGRYLAAYELAMRLDTIVRDAIPQSVWKVLALAAPTHSPSGYVNH